MQAGLRPVQCDKYDVDLNTHFVKLLAEVLMWMSKVCQLKAVNKGE